MGSAFFWPLAKGKKVDHIGDAMMNLSRNSPSHYRELLQGTSALELVVDSSYVFIYKKAEQANLDHFGWHMRLKRNVPVSLIGAAELRDLEPDISPAFQAAILIREVARALNPSAIGKAIAQKAIDSGVSFIQAETKSFRNFMMAGKPTVGIKNILARI